MELNANQNTFGIIPYQQQQSSNKGLMQIQSPNKNQQRSPLKSNPTFQKEMLIQKCEDANPNLFKKYPHIYHNVMEIIDQFSKEGKINENSIDFLQQKVQKEIQFQLNKLRTSNKIGLIENLFYNNPTLQQQSRYIHNSFINSPMQNNIQQKLNENSVNGDQKLKMQQNKAANSNGDLNSVKIQNIHGSNQRSESTNRRNSPVIKPLNLGIISNQLSQAETPQNAQNLSSNKANIYSGLSRNKQIPYYGKAARSSSYMGDVAKKNLILDQILKKKDSTDASTIQENDRKYSQVHRRLNTQEFNNNDCSSANKIQNQNSQNHKNGYSNFREENQITAQFDIQPQSNKISQHQQNINQPKSFGTIAQNNILNTTAVNHQDLEKNRNNKQNLNKSNIDEQYQQEIKKLIELEQEYEKQRIQNIKDKEKIVYNTIKQQWDKQIDWKKSEILKEREKDKEYKKKIEILVQEEINLNNLKSSEKKWQAVQDKQQVLQQIQQQREQKERERSKEKEKERKYIFENELTMKNEQEQQRIIELNKKQQQNIMIQNHIQLSKNMKDNQEKQTRLEEIKRIRDQIAQQHIIDQRKDEEYVHRIGKISKRLF
ncbi:hypothetical protein TTHERM_00218640 (macronuclear) [Tetrahymena thermophila SB210]|uniref:Uncharacterized protein n=1 Tax=Tetrahymena thermophila (strain SB210) TaxID=312017 RepID=I7M2F5_TETTS|nr:hypothetical protein TTHERM_00218640 [Tetrahymena thermophila SB210]EAS00291.4 hypothetical protein TTHERM_00218640 [Tetrahymena thermophila SB210]|eukprot:XP_001020536.4 hypothetical protein TTHERM_00218640 [Tetrahymena thermophila SB210]